MTNREKVELTYRAIQERKMRKANKKLISDVKKVIGNEV
nr:MAG TPA: hypothetical protein [Caudoviricetes sp.]